MNATSAAKKRSRDDNDDDNDCGNSGSLDATSGSPTRGCGALQKHRPVCNQLQFDTKSFALVSRPMYHVTTIERPKSVECSGCLLSKPEFDVERCNRCGVEVCSCCSVRRIDTMCFECMR